MKDQPDTSPDNPELEALSDELLLYLKRTRGIDLSGYKRPSLMRRIRRRMEAVKIDGYERYTDYLEVHPEEFVQLFNYLLINVTAFFRDLPACLGVCERPHAPPNSPVESAGRCASHLERRMCLRTGTL